jgi:hypothetical protein
MVQYFVRMVNQLTLEVSAVCTCGTVVGLTERHDLTDGYPRLLVNVNDRTLQCLVCNHCGCEIVVSGNGREFEIQDLHPHSPA